MGLIFFFLFLYLVTATIRRAWDPDEDEPWRFPWRGLLMLLAVLVVAVLVGAAIWG
jgi:hypothetical protein